MVSRIEGKHNNPAHDHGRKAYDARDLAEHRPAHEGHRLLLHSAQRRPAATFHHEGNGVSAKHPGNEAAPQRFQWRLDRILGHCFGECTSAYRTPTDLIAPKARKRSAARWTPSIPNSSESALAVLLGKSQKSGVGGAIDLRTVAGQLTMGQGNATPTQKCRILCAMSSQSSDRCISLQTAIEVLMNREIENERVKLLATFINNLGVAAFMLGAFIPFMPSHSILELIMTLPVGAVVGLALATLAQLILRDFLCSERNEIVFHRRVSRHPKGTLRCDDAAIESLDDLNFAKGVPASNFPPVDCSVAINHDGAEPAVR
jgi:hypothetical protein